MSRSVPLLLAVALVLVVNPELRALLYLGNALGLELVGVLLALQWRAVLARGLRIIPRSSACRLASRLGYAALAAYPCAASLQALNRLLCPVLISLSYGLTCRDSPQA